MESPKMAVFYDSHRKFKPYAIIQFAWESDREFSRRADREYNDLADRYESPYDGERIYMRYA